MDRNPVHARTVLQRCIRRLHPVRLWLGKRHVPRGEDSHPEAAVGHGRSGRHAVNHARWAEFVGCVKRTVNLICGSAVKSVRFTHPTIVQPPSVAVIFRSVTFIVALGLVTRSLMNRTPVFNSNVCR